VSAERAGQLLKNVNNAAGGSGEQHASVPDFLSLFGKESASRIHQSISVGSAPDFSNSASACSSTPRNFSAGTAAARQQRKEHLQNRKGPSERLRQLVVEQVQLRSPQLAEKELRMVQQMRDALFERRSTMPKMFKSVDLNDDGVVALEEFMHTLEGAGVPVGHEIDRARNEVTEEEAARLLAFFDRQGQGMLRYSEFIRLLQGTLEMPGSPSRGPRCRGLNELADKLEQPRDVKTSVDEHSLSNTGLLRQAIGVDKGDIDLHSRSGGRELQRVQAAFQRWDGDGDGLITEVELLQVLQQLNPGTTLESVRAMMKAADKDGDGAINHQEFVAWLFA